MSLFDLKVEDTILIILDDLNNANDVFALAEVDTINWFPFYQALIALKQSELIYTTDSYSPTPHNTEENHKCIKITEPPIITLQGIKYLSERINQLEKSKARLSGIKTEEVETEISKKPSLSKKVMDISKAAAEISTNLSKISSGGRDTTSILRSIIEKFFS